MTLRQLWLLLVAVLTLASNAAFADPAIHVESRPTGVWVRLEGSFAGASYTILRAESPSGVFRAITASNLLCVGECAVFDDSALPGSTVYYRFDLDPLAGSRVSYGPYAVAVPQSPLTMRLSPNPFRASAGIALSLPASADGTPATAVVRVVDLQGRTVKVLHRGPVARAGLSLRWDGRDETGHDTAPGIYLVQVNSGAHHGTARLVRTR